MNFKEICTAFFLIAISLTDAFVFGKVTISDLCLIFLLFPIIYSRKPIIPKQTIIFILIAIFGLFVGMINNNPIQYKSFVASVLVSFLVGIFSQIKIDLYKQINFGKVVSFILVVLSLFTILDFISGLLFFKTLNFSGLFGNDARIFGGYFEGGGIIVRPCGLFPEPGDNASILSIFVALKLYLNKKHNIKNISNKNISLLLGLFSIAITRSNLGVLTLILIVFYLLYEDLQSNGFLKNLLNRYVIKVYRLKKKNFIIILLYALMLTVSITFVLPRIYFLIAATGTIDLTRMDTLLAVFDIDRGFTDLLLGTSFEIPNLLINSLSQFINLFYQFGILSFILFYIMLRPAFKHSNSLFLFLFILFLSKLTIATIPFWLAIYFCENEFKQTMIEKKIKN